ncbi:RagB/SusD family nutrient uptake outer membrane protein [Pontibacter sp. SGAir0037]|uniref:RagB/SusD family nutrient uptake outer membrane protein n=1 Tax=Pontibacter sp. SGAir0037 TaxID=2571030 RepID=UPI0010CD176D|nr:RagB/SusD family nutrient uptake outer membrane protein [Pontibacter sp. SGAir0037]QCR22268.1 RagB/SusD family nutrient uptake outer membrane protein [Pontibacter sp. SGAir0037]
MKNKFIFGLVFSTMLLSSCNNDFLDIAPRDVLSNDNFWETEEQLVLAVDALYANVKAKNTVDMENMGDNTLWPSTTAYQQIGSGVYGHDLPTLNTEWTTQYQAVRQANAFLENYNKATSVSTARREALAAEARVIRALGYLFLTSFFGDVPLVTTTLTIEEVYGPRNPKEDVIDFILEDLELAATHLPAEIPSGNNLGRMSKGAALGLKARIALYNGRYDIAEKAAKDVMDLKVYQLFNTGDPTRNYYELFTYKGRLANGLNKETMIARMHLPDILMHNLSREIQVPDQVIRWNPTKSLVDSYLMKDGLPIDKSELYTENSYADIFKNRDPRMTQTILSPGAAWGGRVDGRNVNDGTFVEPKFDNDRRGAVTITGYYFTKYAEISTIGQVGRDHNDIHLLRYAEVLLTYAEARMEQGKLTQNDLDISINLLRDRVGMKHMELSELANHGLDVREEIRRERRVELALEGQRWFDLMRWKQGSKLAEDVKGMKKSWAANQSHVANFAQDQNGYIVAFSGRTFVAPRNYLWPVPLAQLQLNPNLGQNPGW